MRLSSHKDSTRVHGALFLAATGTSYCPQLNDACCIIFITYFAQANHIILDYDGFS